MKVIESNSTQDTYQAGYSLATDIKPGTVICLTGDLGVGKTVFTHGFAKGLGVEEYVDSPTFTIVKEYHDGRMPLYHFDVYRIEDEYEMDDIGYEEYFFSDGVSIVEWGKNVQGILPKDTVYVEISKDLTKGFDYRKIVIE